MRRFKLIWRSRFLKVLILFVTLVLGIQLFFKNSRSTLGRSNDYIDDRFNGIRNLNEDIIHVLDKLEEKVDSKNITDNINKKQEVESNILQNLEKDSLNINQDKGDKENLGMDGLRVNQEKGSKLSLEKDSLDVFQEKGDKHDFVKDGLDLNEEKGDKHNINFDVKSVNKRIPINEVNFTKNENRVGYFGEAVTVDRSKMSKEELKKYNEGWRKHSFNEYVSNMISIDRPLVDMRDKRCLPITYPKHLPNTSVIICFHNEAKSTLLRTIHSVINKSPRHLLHEIILVDDASYFGYLKAPLEDHVARLPVPVKIIRTDRRQGLIRGRLYGYEAATGQTLTFLDSHCECNEGWLEPLMARISEGWNHVVWPVIPDINKNTFKMSDAPLSNIFVGVFDWKMMFGWAAARPELMAKRKSDIFPLESPVMAGGLFSINRAYFKHIGTYDDKMDIWGGENLEISFRIWMCGGTLEIIPCSIVGHVFRSHAPYSNIPGSLVKNTLRVAMVWLDEYKHLYLDTLNTIPNYGDISDRLELRKRLKCKSFDWYIKNIYPNAFIPTMAKFRGQIRNDGHTKICIDSMGDYTDSEKKLVWRPCVENSTNQIWYFMDKIPEIRQFVHCLDAGDGSDDTIIMFSCHQMGGNQNFTYTENKTIYFSSRNKCLEAVAGTSALRLRDCNGNKMQMWSWIT